MRSLGVVEREPRDLQATAADIEEQSVGFFFVEEFSTRKECVLHFFFGGDNAQIDVQFFLDRLHEGNAVFGSTEGFGGDGGDVLWFPFFESFGEAFQRVEAALHGFFGEISAGGEFFAQVDGNGSCVQRLEGGDVLRGCLRDDHAARVCAEVDGGVARGFAVVHGVRFMMMILGSGFLSVEGYEFGQSLFDSPEVVVIGEHVVALRIEDCDRVGAFEQLQGFQHVVEWDDFVFHASQHAHGRGAGDCFSWFVEQVVFLGFVQKGLGEDVSLFGCFFGIDPFSDESLLYFLLFLRGKIGEQEFLRKIGRGSDQQHACDVLGLSFEDMECDPAAHGGARDDP